MSQRAENQVDMVEIGSIKVAEECVRNAQLISRGRAAMATSLVSSADMREQYRLSKVPHLVVWDIDRTLIDCGPATHDAFEAALRAVAPGSKLTAAGPRMTGRTDPAVIREVLLASNIARDQIDDLVHEVLVVLPEHFRRMRSRFLVEGRLLPGVREVLGALNALRVHQTVLTGNVQANALLKLELFGLTDLLDLEVAAYGSDAERRNELLSLVLERTARCYGQSLDPGRVWLIGDTPDDLACARGSGVRCLLVATGLYQQDSLVGLDPDGVLEDLGDLDRVLFVLCGG